MSETQPMEPRPIIGDVVVSKFGNRWRVVSAGELGVDYVTLHNVPPESPNADGTIYGGTFPSWADRIERNGLRVWQRPTPKCECPSFANAKGPYPNFRRPDQPPPQPVRQRPREGATVG